MTDTYSLGAINTITKQYTLPHEAEKTAMYSCTDCGQRVIPRKGTKRRAHFAHYSPTNTCTYYEHPNESQLHKDAKHKLMERLNKRLPIEITNCCPKCGISPASSETNGWIIEYSENDVAQVEYRDPNGKFVADVVVLNKGTIKYIFEIQHTHKTLTNVRPEPWFEFNAQSVLDEEESVINNPDNNLYMLSCLREGKIRYCDGCKATVEPWAENLPRLRKKVGIEEMWKQESPCIVCGRSQYNPAFIRGHRQVCKICLCNNMNELKQKYDISTTPMFLDD